ncbi:VOC family protein [Solitalea sp. MAHUQ-68]|uniref:VOC family protein n=1 Tax=Solitalea agri TaxID=2953739 RepID=A0A9X2F286_9SPHI|nr:VOC family protein [Solitalea agri]MCO4292881.1 VOC family protein [Solitalea agri]
MKFTQALILVFYSLLISSCQQKFNVPPVSKEPTNVYTPGRFVWHDLVTPDVEQSKKFYGEVFGWNFETIGSGETSYTVIKKGDEDIGGIFPIPSSSKVNTGEWVASLSVNNINEAVNQTVLAGGKILRGVKELNGRGKTALVSDPQGGILAYIKAIGGDPVIKKPELNSWLGMELWTNNVEESKSFYRSLVGYETEDIKETKMQFTAFTKQGKICAAILKNPVANVRTHWMPYIRVENVVSTLDKAKAAGATILLAPSPEVRNSSVAIILDPQRAPLVLQEFTPQN